ncbi:hypothetical protein [Nocardioides sp.]|uniref:hypothetical protein n=1 Tax=Nocardioides sp. TaxID=35761 RepID=UPI002634A502|nr:hypothetical protein [Nocardioides sp.]MDI6911490.1 hypothetical protein [Nocardioides sp.]
MADLVDRVLEALGRAFVTRAGDALPNLLDGLADPLRDADDRLAATDRGWAAAFDLDATPEPRWIGSATGTSVPGGLTLAEQRDYVRDRATWRRGTPEAIKGAVRAILLATNSRRVDLLEREGSPWRLGVRVWAAEVPAGGSVAVLAAAKTQTPVGILVDVHVESGATYEHMAEYHGPTYEDALAAFPLYDSASPVEATSVYHVPEEGTDV